MSIYPQIWAETAPVTNAIQRCILVLLAETAMPNGAAAVHHLEALADYAVCDIDTILENLADLQAQGLLRLGEDLHQRIYAICSLVIPRHWYSTAQWVDMQEQMKQCREKIEAGF